MGKREEEKEPPKDSLHEKRVYQEGSGDEAKKKYTDMKRAFARGMERGERGNQHEQHDHHIDDSVFILNYNCAFSASLANLKLYKQLKPGEKEIWSMQSSSLLWSSDRSSQDQSSFKTGLEVKRSDWLKPPFISFFHVFPTPILLIISLSIPVKWFSLTMIRHEYISRNDSRPKVCKCNVKVYIRRWKSWILLMTGSHVRADHKDRSSGTK